MWRRRQFGQQPRIAAHRSAAQRERVRRMRYRRWPRRSVRPGAGGGVRRQQRADAEVGRPLQQKRMEGRLHLMGGPRRRFGGPSRRGWRPGARYISLLVPHRGHDRI